MPCTPIAESATPWLRLGLGNSVGRAWTVERYLACEHVAPMPNYEGARGVIDDHLVKQGLLRDIAVRSAHFALIPAMVAGTKMGRPFFAESMKAASVEAG